MIAKSITSACTFVTMKSIIIFGIRVALLVVIIIIVLIGIVVVVVIIVHSTAMACCQLEWIGKIIVDVIVARMCGIICTLLLRGVVINIIFKLVGLGKQRQTFSLSFSFQHSLHNKIIPHEKLVFTVSNHTFKKKTKNIIK